MVNDFPYFEGAGVWQWQWKVV